jgi:hypothetical protein
VCFLGTERICPSRVANVNVKGRKVVEFGFLETGPAEGAEEGKTTTSIASPILRKIEIEIGTDPSPNAMDLSAIAVKQESQEKDEIAAVVSEPGIAQPEQVVDLVMQELAREQGENVQVVKAE